jgi:hypothetical protein
MHALNDVGRVALYGLALTGSPVAGVLLLLANRGWVAHYNDKPWPLLLFCVGTPVFLAAATSALARLHGGSALLLLLTAAVGGVISIGVLLALAAAAGDLS